LAQLLNKALHKAPQGRDKGQRTLGEQAGEGPTQDDGVTKGGEKHQTETAWTHERNPLGPVDKAISYGRKTKEPRIRRTMGNEGTKGINLEEGGHWGLTISGGTEKAAQAWRND